MSIFIEEMAGALDAHAEIRLAYLFGSASRGEERAESDVDVGIVVDGEVSPELSEKLCAELEDITGRRVDLVVLTEAPPLLRREAIRGPLLVSRDEDERVAFETRTVALYVDTAHLRSVQHEYLRARIEARNAGQR